MSVVWESPQLQAFLADVTPSTYPERVLVGRDAELEDLGRALTALGTGEPGALVLVGEAGIGKSALLRAAADEARRAGARVLEGRAAEYEGEVPFGLAVDALDEPVATLHPARRAAVAGDLGGVLPSAGDGAAATAGPAERFRLHRALRALIEHFAQERPVVLILDDVHWADPASVEWVLHLLRRPPAGGVLLIAALRPIGPADDLLDAVRSSPGGRSLTLGPLPEAAADALVRAVADPQRRAQITREAGGNPLYLGELVRAAATAGDRLPATLLAAIGLEVRRLAPAARALIDGAAIAGDPFDVDLAAVAAGLGDDVAGPLDELAASGLARPGGDPRSFVFRHPLVRRAVREATPPGWRLNAHARVADALRERGAPPAALAHHLEQSARPGDARAVTELVRAAEATVDGSPAAAARWYAAALRLDTGAGRAPLLVPMALALASSGRLEESRAALEEALGLLAGAPPAERLPVVGACAQVEQLLGRHREAIARLESEVERAPAQARAALEIELATAGLYLVDAELLHRWAPRALADADGAVPGLVVGAAALVALDALWSGRDEERGAAFARAAAAFDRLTDEELAERIDAALLFGFCQGLSDQVDASFATLTRGLRVARATRQDAFLATLTNVRGMLAINLGDLDVALADAEAAEEMFRLAGARYQLNWALWTRALIQYHRGEAVEADRAAQEALELIATLEDTTITVTGRCNIPVLRAEEDPDGAIEAMVAAGGPLLERTDPSWSAWLLVELVRAAIAAGRTEDAERWAAHIETLVQRHQLRTHRGRALVARAELAHAAGDHTGAAARAAEAAATFDDLGAGIEALDARVVEGRARAALGEREPAVELLQGVAAQAAAWHAFRLRDLAARELRRLGTRVAAPGRRAADRAGGLLSERETEIARLVADGRSNKQVAGALFLSEKTIENNLSRIYAKLGVRTRAELGDVL